MPRPSTTQRKPPIAVGSATPFAANTSEFVRRPSALAPSSYQTTHGTVSFGPVNAMSGSRPSRVGSMFRLASTGVAGVNELGETRAAPTSCQQKPPITAPPAGSVPAAHAGVAVLTARETKIWFLPPPGPSFSCQAIHGTGGFPAVVAPPATAGFSASRSVLMLMLGAPAPRSWPATIQRFAAASKCEATICVSEPIGASGSYHAVHGTVRPGPAKSMLGASASAVGSTFSEAGEPFVTQRVPSKARTKISCPRAVRFSNAAQGAGRAPATSAPPTMSLSPAPRPAAMPRPGSRSTRSPLAGNGDGAAAATAGASASASRPRVRGAWWDA